MGITGAVCTIVINKNIISPGIAPAVIIVCLDNLAICSSYPRGYPKVLLYPFLYDLDIH